MVARDLLVGESWLCAGQSNMEFRVTAQPGYVGNVKNMAREVAAADHPQLRMYLVARHMTLTPQDATDGRWLVCSPQTVGKFSAVAYSFGLDLHRALHVPVGIVLASYGGTHAQSCMSQDTLGVDPLFEPYLKQVQAERAAYTPAVAEREADQQRRFKAAAVAARAAGKPVPPGPRLRDPMRSNASPYIFYNGMLAPLAPYPIRGFAWYQGESNTPHPQDYVQLQTALVRSWRTLWHDGDLPFILTQLCNVNPPATQPQADDGWTGLRAAQARTAMAVAHTGMAVTIDVGTAAGVHPTDKQDVGRRLALVAEADVYHLPVESSGPVPSTATVDGDRVRLTFAHAAGLRLTPAAPNSGFDVADRDGKRAWASAAVDGSTVVLTCPNVPHPTQVRYDWADNPAATLYNAAGLPAAPFEVRPTSAAAP